MNGGIWFWFDFVTNPYWIFMSGWIGGIPCALMVAGLCGILGVNTKHTRIAFGLSFVIVSLLIWASFILLVVWYNTPMGPPLELK